MKRLFHLLVIGLLLGLASIGWATSQASAAESSPHIKDIIGEKTILMSDGSMWSLINGNQVIRTKGSIDAISGTEYEGLGLTQDGKLVEWDIAKGPTFVKDQMGIKQVAGYFWLKTDGSVWTHAGKVKNLDKISLIGYGDRGFAALAQNGDLLFKDPYKEGVYRKLGTITDPGSAKDLAVYEGRVALLYHSGKVVVYETYNFDDHGKVIPVTIAEDAVHIVYTDGDPTDQLLVTRKDGTVWKTGNYQDRWKLANQVTGLTDIEKTAVLENSERFYAKRSSGSWVMFDEGEVKPVDVPSVNKLDVSISDLKPFVGDNLNVDIQETYTNGAKIKVRASDAEIEVQKPYLLQLQPNNKLKVLGVGETKVTVISSGVSKSLNVSASLRTNLKYSKQLDGQVFVPAKSVLHALGGTVSVSGGTMDVKFGEVTLSFKAGSSEAVLNGDKVKLNAAPRSDKGEILIPVSLISDALGARTKWDSKWKQAEISLGEAKMTIVSTETASLIKKAAQGSLSKFIGKSYWINYFEGWDRFSKVTITDIVPDDTGFFTIVFRSASGKVLKSYSMSSSNVSQLLADDTYFYKFDPYKKYKWSSSIWKQVKAEQVSLGMTKEQVRMSWGVPGSKSVTAVNGQNIEIWMYANFNTVSFVNGKVYLIIS